MPDLLVVIDLQPAFAHPESPWFTPGLDDIAARLTELLPRFENRTLFTRFVPPETPFGSWIPYYEKWPFALDPAAAWLWRIDPRFTTHPTVAAHTFSKWHAIRAHLGGGETVLCGVSTECCVLMTALAAVDDGAHVRVISDACAAKDRKTHDDALALMATRAPQLRITTLAEELAQ